MDYGDAVQYLDRCLVFGIKPSLVRIKKLLQVMDNPQKGIDFIHIVGSNGKTSTTRMTAAILYGQGIDCGYHISPHIKDYTERFWYNGGDISREEFASLFEEIYPLVQQVNDLDLNGNMTQFEIIAGMGFLMAKNFGLQVMVLEAGMGGRWDATNAVYSRVVGLTGVSLEHTSILGNSIEEIAVEKAEVLKQGAVAATTSEDKQVIDVLKNKASKVGGQVLAYRKDFDFNHFWDQDTDSWSVDMKGIRANYDRLKLVLKGQYQVKNMALAVVLSELYLGDRKLDEEKLKKVPQQA
ncbi:MAG: hypothetical protein U5N58_05375 [Actinomycetota bacterium]|nr:hypothetical protein [Actinomycetota bacterium]